MKVEKKTVTMDEAVEFIKKDCSISHIIDTAGAGYLTETELPFEPPIKCKNGVVAWPPVHIHPGAKIGKKVIIGRFTNICGAVEIGDNVRIQGFCFIPDSVIVKKNVFIGPNVTFCNDKYPKINDDGSVQYRRDGVITIEEGASIGAGVTICPGVTIEKNAMVGAGAVVTKDVKMNTTVVGVPSNEKTVK